MATRVRAHLRRGRAVREYRREEAARTRSYIRAPITLSVPHLSKDDIAALEEGWLPNATYDPKTRHIRLYGASEKLVETILNHEHLHAALHDRGEIGASVRLDRLVFGQTAAPHGFTDLRMSRGGEYVYDPDTGRRVYLRGT